MFKISCQTLAVVALLTNDGQVNARGTNDIIPKQTLRNLEDTAADSGAKTADAGSGTAAGSDADADKSGDAGGDAKGAGDSDAKAADAGGDAGAKDGAKTADAGDKSDETAAEKEAAEKKAADEKAAAEKAAAEKKAAEEKFEKAKADLIPLQDTLTKAKEAETKAKDAETKAKEAETAAKDLVDKTKEAITTGKCDGENKDKPDCVALTAKYDTQDKDLTTAGKALDKATEDVTAATKAVTDAQTAVTAQEAVVKAATPPPDCSAFKLTGKQKHIQQRNLPYDYENADKKNVIYSTWADAFLGDPEGCEPKECRSFVGDCVGDKFTKLEKPWKFELPQSADGILNYKYCYQCETETGQLASQKVLVVQAADCKATLSLTANAAKKTKNPLPETKDAEDGNDGTKAKEDAAAAADAKDAGTKTDGDKAGDAGDAGKTDGDKAGAGRRRLDDHAGSDSSTDKATDKDAEKKDDEVVTTNPEDFYLPMGSYQDNDKPVPVLDAVNYFFHNSKQATCGIAKCELMLPGCKEPYTGDKLSIADSYPYTLSAMLNIVGGYQDKFCFKCSNVDDRSTISKDNIVFTQPHRCLQSLTSSSVYSFDAPVMAYDPLVGKHEFAQSWDRLFDSNHPKDCPIKKCQLVTQKPDSDPPTYLPLTTEQAEALSVGPAPDYALYQQLTVNKGYSYNVNLECDNGYQKIYHEMTIAQTSKCETALYVKKDVDPKLLKGFKVPYSTDLSTLLPTIWDKDVFYSIDEAVCPITSCNRYLPGCNTPITGLTNTMFLNKPAGIQLSVNTNALRGWKTEICIVCTNGAQKITADNFVAEQGNVCAFGFDVLPNPLSEKLTNFAYDGSPSSNRKLGTGYTSFFKPKDATMAENCVLQNQDACVLFEKDCNTKYTGTNVEMSKTLPYQITTKANIWEGHKEDLCLKCIVSQKIGNTQVLGAQTLTQSIKIHQTSRCLQTLKLAEIPLGPKIVKNHDSVSYSKTVAPGYQSFFVNMDVTHCPVKSCEILAKDCKSPYKSLALQINPKTFAIEVGPKATPNKDEEFCYKCGNGYADITYNGLTVEQTGSCLNVLSQKDIKKDAFNKLGLKWHQEKTPVKITDAEAFFDNSRESICPMTKCTLLKGDCKTPNTNKNVVLEDKWPYNIMTNQQSILGYDDEFCIQCQIDDQESTGKPFRLTQKSKCLTTLKASATTYPMKVLDFNPETSVDEAKLGSSYKTFFVNTDTENCPVTNCEILAKGCQGPSSANYISVNRQDNFLLQAQSNYVDGYDTKICYKCSNEYMSQTYDNIQVLQKAIPKESKEFWILIGVLIFVMAIVCIFGTWWVHHSDVKKEEKWRSKYMAERLEQIGKNHDQLQQRHSVHIVHAQQFNDLKEQIALHPDFADGGRYQRGATMVAKSGGMGNFKGHQGTSGQPDMMELPDLMPGVKEPNTVGSKQALIQREVSSTGQSQNGYRGNGYVADHNQIDVGLSGGTTFGHDQGHLGMNIQEQANHVQIDDGRRGTDVSQKIAELNYDGKFDGQTAQHHSSGVNGGLHSGVAGLGSGAQLIQQERSIEQSQEYDHAQADQALKMDKRNSAMPSANINSSIVESNKQNMAKSKSVIMSGIQNKLQTSVVSSFKDRMANIKLDRQKSVFVPTKELDSHVEMDDSGNDLNSPASPAKN